MGDVDLSEPSARRRCRGGSFRSGLLRINVTKVSIALASVAALASVSLTVSAHHSTAMFDWGNALELKNATVVRWEWTNPHTYLYVTAAGANGAQLRWAFEGMSPSHLARAGWSRSILRAGDRVDLVYYPLRDKRNGGFNVAVTLQDGTRLEQLPAR